MYDMISLRYSCAASVPAHIPGIRDAVSRRNKHLLFVFTNVKVKVGIKEGT